MRIAVHEESHMVGAGLGTSHQTGWTGFIAKQIQFFGRLDPTFLARGRSTGIFYPEST